MEKKSQENRTKKPSKGGVKRAKKKGNAGELKFKDQFGSQDEIKRRRRTVGRGKEHKKIPITRQKTNCKGARGTICNLLSNQGTAVDDQGESEGENPPRQQKRWKTVVEPAKKLLKQKKTQKTKGRSRKSGMKG